MSQTINNFKDNFNGGTRTNRFRIRGSFSSGGAWNDFHVIAADMPQVNLIPQAFDYRGRKLILPGDRIYGQQPGGTNWTVTVLDDTGDNQYWIALQTWSNSINQHEENIGTQDDPSSYKESGWVVEQLDLNCANVLKRATLYGCWPSMVGPIELNMSKVDEYVMFQTTFVFDFATFDN